MASRISHRTPYVLFFLSGIAGLGYQIVWARMFSVGLGHELPSLLAVITAFFGGFALGAVALDRRVSASRKPGHWYAALEVVIGVWALASIFVIPWINARASGLTGVEPGPIRHWAVAFLIPFATLLPATAAMGATLAAMDRLTSRMRGDGRSVGGLYASNTLGAVAGTLGAAWVLIPAFGYPVTLIGLAALNFLCAALALAGPARGEVEREPVVDPGPRTLSQTRLFATILATGFLGIGYEVVVVRVLAQVLENTVFSFASTLSVYLLGTAVGAALYQWKFPRDQGLVGLDWLLHGLCAACAAGVAVLFGADVLYERLSDALGNGLAASILAEMIVAGAAFVTPCLLMGATFSHLAQAARHERGGVGAAVALNTLGGALAPVVIGVVLFAALGAKFTLVVLASGYLLLAPRTHFARFAVAVVFVLVVAAAPRSLLLIRPKHGEFPIASKEGVVASAAVLSKRSGELVLSVNNKYQMGGTGPGEFLERRQAHIPLMVHPEPKQVLFLGVGTGITFAAADVHPGVEAEGVELLSVVVDLLEHFRAANRAIFSSEDLTLRVADARRFVRATPLAYDVIVADLFHPSRDGSGSLYTTEHFETVSDRLAPGGLFCQWLPLYQLDEPVLRMIVGTFVDVFPHAAGFLAYYNVETPVLGLIGSEGPLRVQPSEVERRLADERLRSALDTDGLGGVSELVGCYLAPRASLVDFAEDAPRNTDTYPRVTFAAPRFAYREADAGRRNLEALLARFRPQASEIVDAGTMDEPTLAELDAFLAARERYLRGSIALVTGDTTSGHEALVEALETSDRFQIGYNAVVEYANELRVADPGAARRLLERLRKARPDRPEAGAILKRLSLPGS